MSPKWDLCEVSNNVVGAVSQIVTEVEDEAADAKLGHHVTDRIDFKPRNNKQHG